MHIVAQVTAAADLMVVLWNRGGGGGIGMLIEI
jgi:hypothetical protein